MAVRKPLFQNAGVVTEAAATDSLGVLGGQRKDFDIGDGTSTSFPLTHNFGISIGVGVTVTRNASPKDQVYPDVEETDSNTITIKFGSPPTTNQFHVVAWG